MKFSKHLNASSIAAVVVLAVIAGYDFFAPLPTSQFAGKPPQAQKLRRDLETKRTELDSAEKSMDALMWQTTRDEIGPQAMAWVSDKARAHFLDVKSFRAQRSKSSDGFDQLSYMVIAEGSFPNAMKFVKEFEAQDSLLSINLIQIASVNGATDDVRISIGLVAFTDEGTDG